MVDAVSLFSGCGGSDAGVTDAGFKIIMANDVLSYAKDVYLTNLPETEYILGNIEEIKKFPEAPLLIGCYPCQGFSQGGVRDPSRKINKLYIEFERALKQISPKAFIVENVSGMIRKDFQHLLIDQLLRFKAAGYNVKAKILNASDFGVPQDRKRIFIVGIRVDIEYEFPLPTYGTEGKPAKKTIKEAIKHLPSWPTGEFYDREFHWYYMSRNRRKGWDEQSKTIVANPRHMPLHPMSPTMIKHAHNDWRFTEDGDSKARRFSYREAALLQGFDRMSFPETQYKAMNKCYEVVGNAVPPPLFKAIVDSIPDIW